MNNELRNKVAHALDTGDMKSLYEALEIATANDAQRAQEEEARRQAQLDAFKAETKPVSRYKIIAIDGRVGRRRTRLYITGVSYKPGPGFKTSKISYNADKSKAHEFSTVAAESIAEYLIKCGYTPHIEAKDAL